MRHIFLLLLAAFAITACGTSRRVKAEPAQPWVGYSTQDILARMGDPTRIDTDKRGGSILVYESDPDYSSPDYDILAPEESASPRRYARFFLDDEGVCYRVDTNRNLPAPPNGLPAMVRRAVWLDVLIWVPIFLIGVVF